MQNFTQYVPTVISAVLAAVLILTVVTNIIVQVLKNLIGGRIPANAITVAVAMAVTLTAFFATASAAGITVVWYMVAGAIALGLFVAYAAMFGYDKFRETLNELTKIK